MEDDQWRDELDAADRSVGASLSIASLTIDPTDRTHVAALESTILAATFEPTAAAEVHAGEPPQNGITFTGYGLYRSTDLGATFTKVPINPWTTLKPGDVDVNTGRGGAYATYWNQGFYVNTKIYGGYNSYDTSRQTLLQGHFANGSTEGYEFSTFADTGYDFGFGNLSLGPVFLRPIHKCTYRRLHRTGFVCTASNLI